MASEQRIRLSSAELPRSMGKTWLAWAAKRPQYGPVGVVALFVLVVLLLPPGNLPSPNFYTVAAQIMPVLLVALAVEARLRDVWDKMPGSYRAQLIATLMIGETIAILAASGVLASGRDIDYEEQGIVGPGVGGSRLMAAATACALVTGFLSVIVVALVKDPLSFARTPVRGSDEPGSNASKRDQPGSE